jgi:hypothetical protein
LFCLFWIRLIDPDFLHHAHLALLGQPSHPDRVDGVKRWCNFVESQILDIQILKNRLCCAPGQFTDCWTASFHNLELVSGFFIVSG